MRVRAAAPRGGGVRSTKRCGAEIVPSLFFAPGVAGNAGRARELKESGSCSVLPRTANRPRLPQPRRAGLSFCAIAEVRCPGSTWLRRRSGARVIRVIFCAVDAGRQPVRLMADRVEAVAVDRFARLLRRGAAEVVAGQAVAEGHA